MSKEKLKKYFSKQVIEQTPKETEQMNNQNDYKLVNEELWWGIDDDIIEDLNYELCNYMW